MFRAISHNFHKSQCEILSFGTLLEELQK